MDYDIWHALPAEVRDEVNALLRRGRRVHAIAVIRDAFPEPKPSIHRAMDVIGARMEDVGLPPFTPTPPN